MAFWRGGKGPQHVDRTRVPNELTDLWVRAAETVGIERTVGQIARVDNRVGIAIQRRIRGQLTVDPESKITVPPPILACLAIDASLGSLPHS